MRVKGSERGNMHDHDNKHGNMRDKRGKMRDKRENMRGHGLNHDNVAILFGGDIHWKSRRKRVIATSTAEAEVIALSDASHEVVWLVEMLRALDLIADVPLPSLLTDNQAAHKLTTSDGPGRNKSLSLRAAFVKDLIKRERLVV
jgi:hypothetical protein